MRPVPSMVRRGTSRAPMPLVPGFRLAEGGRLGVTGWRVFIVSDTVISWESKANEGDGGALDGGTGYAIKNELPNLRKLCRL
jgi:hypothetical protein